MNVLVIIPSLMHKYSFSSPLAWLFSNHIDRVTGCYSFSLTRDIVCRYDFFIVELNWFIELYEFGLIVRFIKKYNPDARILFGGIHSQLKYKEIFQTYDVDYFIKGDNELPIGMFLEGVDPRTIPNMVGRDFENEQTYFFRQGEFTTLEFNLDWFPEFSDRWNEFPEPEKDVPTRFDKLPIMPRYWEPFGSVVPIEYRWRIPPKGGRYHLPMLITGRGACPVVHKGCDYCMGSKTTVMNDLFKRPSLVMENATLIHLLRKIEKKFDKVSIFINTRCSYDFTGHHFNLDATIEFDTYHNLDDVQKVISAFRTARLHMGLYTEGLVGSTVRTDIDAFRRLEDDNHRIYFFAHPDEARTREIPEERRLYAENIFPYWADWKYYTDSRKAILRSRRWYWSTGQVNLYPPPRKIMVKISGFFIRRLLFLLGKSGIVDLKKMIT